jgi:hypothetical protein
MLAAALDNDANLGATLMSAIGQKADSSALASLATIVDSKASTTDVNSAVNNLQTQINSLGSGGGVGSNNPTFRVVITVFSQGLESKKLYNHFKRAYIALDARFSNLMFENDDKLILMAPQNNDIRTL